MNQACRRKPEDQLFARNLEERIMGLLGAMIPEASQGELSSYLLVLV
jgi:hypothetical protein